MRAGVVLGLGFSKGGASGGGGGGGDTVLDLSRDISSPEILALFSSPKELIPAPGVGKMIIVEWYFVAYKFGSVEYIVSQNMEISYGGNKTGITTVGFIGQEIFAGEDAAAYGPGMGYAGNDYTLQSNWANKNLTLAMQSLDPTTGNGTMRVTIQYRTVNLSDLWPA